MNARLPALWRSHACASTRFTRFRSCNRNGRSPADGGLFRLSGGFANRPQLPAPGASAAHTPSTQGLELTAVVGSGSGMFNLVHTESDRGGTADAQITISVHGVPPNTLLHVLRGGDVGLPNGQQADGVCQRATAGLFGPIPVPGGGGVTLETSAGGAGSTHVHLSGPTPEGTTSRLRVPGRRRPSTGGADRRPQDGLLHAGREVGRSGPGFGP